MSPRDHADVPEPRSSPAYGELAINASHAVAKMLKSPEMQRLWALYHKSRAQEKVPEAIADIILENSENLSNNPLLVKFMQELLRIERGAMEKSKSGDPENLIAMENFFESVLPKKVPPEKPVRRLINFFNRCAISKPVKLALTSASALGESLVTGNTYNTRIATMQGEPLYIKTPVLSPEMPEDFKRILDILRKDTLQKSLAHSVRDFAIAYYQHVKQHFDAHPKTFTAMAVGTGALFGYMAQPRVTIDPDMVGFTGMELDAAGVVKDFQSLSQPSDFNVCLNQHYHYGIVKDCGFLQNLDIRAHDALMTTYEFVKTPYDWVMTGVLNNPLSTFGSQTLQNSHFMAAFNGAAESVSNTIYLVNTYENLLLHTIIAVAGAIEGYSAATKGSQHHGLTDQESREAWTSIKDFFNRCVYNRPTMLKLAPLGVVADAVLGGGFDSGSLWAGVATGSLGYAIDSFQRIRGRSQHVANITGSANTNVQVFAEAAQQQGVLDSVAKPLKKQWMRWRTKVALTGGMLSAYATTVFSELSGYTANIQNELAQSIMIKASEVAGALTSSGLILVAFVPFNLVEDTAQHLIFGAGGATLGYGAGALVSLKRRLLSAPAPQPNPN